MNCFIEPELKVNPKIQQPASYVRKSFLISKEVKTAVLKISALGVYKGYLNSCELDEQVLLPGYTDYHYRLQYQSYNVTSGLRHGENVIAAVIGDGWYRGCLGIGSKRNNFGTRIKFICHLDITYTDGTKQFIHTDETWKAMQEGPILENDLKTIEHVDARKEMSGWNAPGFDDTAWHGVKKASYDGELISQEGERILGHEKFTPEVLITPNGETVLDFKQNMAGRVTFALTGRAGVTVTLTMGETLDENGNFTMKNLAAEGAGLISGIVGQKVVYTLKDGKQTYTPFFNICGFRYVLLEGWPEEIKAENFTATAIYSDLKQTGTFECSNPLINQLVHNVKWSQRSNFVDIPTDCPTRERSGWTADISVFGETACYLTDTRKFIRKWIHDFELEQREDGSLPFVVPSSGKGDMQRSCEGWSDAIANIAMILYRFYGEEVILEEVYDTVKGFVEFNVRRARKKNPFLFFKTGKHRRYIIETGFHYGEWLEPGTAMYKDYIKDLFVPDTEVTTAWFYHTADQLSQMAEILGKKEDAEHYVKLANEIRHAYRKEFLTKELVTSKRHCRYVRPVAMNLATTEEKKAIAEKLDRNCIENDYRIGTGFLTTHKLLPVLSDYGYVDTAYRVLENTKQPGWLYAVTKGATTTWENWYGVDEHGMPRDSHNHYAPGSVVAWLFSDCAGIKPLAPGFKKILLKPIPGGTLTYAKAVFESCRGKIVSDWKVDDGEFSLIAEIPKGVDATVIMPDSTQYKVSGGQYTFTCIYTLPPK